MQAKAVSIVVSRPLAEAEAVEAEAEWEMDVI